MVGSTGSIRAVFRVLCILATVLLLFTGCQSGGGTIVTMTLNPVVSQTEVGTHYEIFAVVDGQPALLRRLEIKQVDFGEGTIIKVVRDFDRPELDLGVVDGVDPFGRFISGVRFRVSDNLRGATELYLVKKPNEEESAGTNEEVLMDCTLEERSLDILSCTLASPLDKQFVLGTASLVLPDESWAD